MQTEYANVPLHVWRSVNIVHHVQIPPEFNYYLQLQTPPPSLRVPRKPGAPLSDRKGTSNSSSPTNKSSALPGKPRSGSNSQQPMATLSRSTGAAVSAMPNMETRDKRPDPPPSRMKLPDFDASSAGPRRLISVRPPTVPVTSNIDNRQQASIQRNNIVSQPTHSRSPSASSVLSRVTVAVTRPLKEREDELSSASSGSGSSDGMESLSDSTVVSDGAFTDYLSDESEAELQRQAEARAALLAQTQMEEMEFKAARLQLAHVDLRPPKLWRGK
jgi:hypothetical protein